MTSRRRSRSQPQASGPSALLPPTNGTAADPNNSTRRGWLLGPWLDLFFIANIGWPLVLLAQSAEGFVGRDGVQFWQLYYITTPHRWITLVLVFLDRERFQERRVAFLLIAAAVIAICVGVRLTTGALTCLLTIDYIWNAWHFSAQHHGIYRIYDRLADPTRTSGVFLEKWMMRFFLLYVILRVAGATWANAVLDERLKFADWLVLAVPALLIANNLFRARARSLGKTAYLVSVTSLYVGMLFAAHYQLPRLILTLATASALFHAIEYLSLVSWQVNRRHAAGTERTGVLGHLGSRWIITLGLFVVILGACGWLLDQHLMQAWLVINVVVAFLHYAYDGMIWRYRPKMTAVSASQVVAVHR